MQLWLVITLRLDFMFRGGDGNGVIFCGCGTRRFSRGRSDSCWLFLLYHFLCNTHSATCLFLKVIPLLLRLLLELHLPCHSNSLHFRFHVLHLFLGVSIKESIEILFVLFPLIAHYLLESACRSLISIRDGGFERESCGLKGTIIAHVCVVQF